MYELSETRLRFRRLLAVCGGRPVQRRAPHGGRLALLLRHVRQLVRHHPPTLQRCGRLAFAKHDMVASRVGVRLDAAGGLRRLVVGVHPHRPEVAPQARLEEGPRGGVERHAGGAERLVYAGRRLAGDGLRFAFPGLRMRRLLLPLAIFVAGRRLRRYRRVGRAHHPLSDAIGFMLARVVRGADLELARRRTWVAPRGAGGLRVGPVPATRWVDRYLAERPGGGRRLVAGEERTRLRRGAGRVDRLYAPFVDAFGRTPHRRPGARRTGSLHLRLRHERRKHACSLRRTARPGLQPGSTGNSSTIRPAVSIRWLACRRPAWRRRAAQWRPRWPGGSRAAGAGPAAASGRSGCASWRPSPRTAGCRRRRG